MRSATPRKKPGPGGAAAGPRRILLVDDDAQVRRFLAGLLRGAGYVVDEARDGLEALVLYRKGPPSCIVIDLQMPVMNGVDALVAMDPRRSGVPVIAMSGIPFETEAEPRRLAKTLGALRFLPKPVNGATLLAAILELTIGKG